MLYCVIALSFLANIVFCINSTDLRQTHYAIIAPKHVRPYSAYHVSLTLFHCNENNGLDNDTSLNSTAIVRIGIEDVHTNYKNERSVTLEPNKTRLITLQLNDIKYYRTYQFIAEGVSGLKFKENVTLKTEIKNISLLIQTDKAIYKPADVIKFRILVLDHKLRPAVIDGKSMNVYILDGDRNRVKYWKKVLPAKGVFSNELQLSSAPVIGDWSIVAEINGDTETKSKKIEVAEYVLPNFEVTIDSSDHFSFKDRKIRAIVRSKYTYGKSVKGKAIVSIKAVSSYEEGDSNFVVIKTIAINRKAPIEFDLEREIKATFSRYVTTLSFNINAVVIEDFTGRNQTKTKQIFVHQSRYKITVGGDTSYKLGSPLEITVKVTYHDDSPVPITNDTNEVILGKSEVYTIYTLDSNGFVKIRYPTNPKEKLFLFKIKYLDEEISTSFYFLDTKADEPILNINVLTKKPRIRQKVAVEVRSQYEMESLSYLVVSHGRILAANTSFVPSRMYQVITFLASFEYVPAATFIAYYFKENSLVSDQTTIRFEKDYNNFVQLKTPSKRVHAGDNVTIDIVTNAGSYVGLLAVDKSVLLLKSGNDLDRSGVHSELNEYGTRTHGTESPDSKRFRDFSAANVFLLTDVPSRPFVEYEHHYDPSAAYFISPEQESLANRFSDSEATEIKVRKDFPEVWLWESISDDGFNGTRTLARIAPDTITSWVISAFSIDPEKGLALTKISQPLEVFQSFFISMHLPYSVKRDEVLSIPVLLFNYLKTDMDTEISFFNEDNEFEFMQEESSDNKTDERKVQTKQVTINKRDSISVPFLIRPTKVGPISIKVIAKSAIASDAILKILLVEPEGIPKYGNEVVFIDLRKSDSLQTNVKFVIPDDVVPDSLRIEASCLGDILGGTIKNLQKLIRMPLGCGEQNMLNFVPNIVILDYLTATEQLNNEIKETAKKYMEKGYQRQLIYKHSDGSFSAFGKSDKSGSTWLTAFVAKSFRRAARYIDIEDRIIEMALKWLSNLQREDGSFPEVGRILHKEMQSGSGNGVALTAYALIAFLENQRNSSSYEDVISKSIDNVIKNIEGVDDVYALALSAYALQLAGHQSKANVLDRLLSKLNVNADNTKSWSSSRNDELSSAESKSINIEVTAYGLLTLIEANMLSDGVPIFKWILKQRNSQGGFEGTQDTIIGLQALALYAEKLSIKNRSLDLTLKMDKSDDFHFAVNDDNALTLQSFELPDSGTSIEIDAKGYGIALLQISYSYNLNEDLASSEMFSITPRLTERTTPAHVNLEVCMSFKPQNASEKTSNMVVLEVSLPTGFMASTDNLYALAQENNVKKIETQNSDSVIVLYFDSLNANEENCLIFEGYRVHKIAEQKSVPIVIYDYYDSSRRSSVLYKVPSMTFCDICEGDDCANLCIKGGLKIATIPK